MKKTSIIVLPILCTFALCSCVTLFGKRQTLSITSSPNGAKVYVDGDYVGITPFKLRTKGTFDYLTFYKDGYYSSTVATSTKMNGNVWWNLLFTGPIGVAADVPYFFKFRVTEYAANLKPLPEPTVSPPSITSTSVTEKRANSTALSSITLSYSNMEMKPKEIFKKYNSAVFMIYTSDNRGSYQGSGFFVSSDGIGISNYHVFEGTFKGKEVIKLSNGRKFKVKDVLAYSKQHDYIVFKVEGSGFNYIPVTTRGYEIGERVYAIGSPRGLENTISDGLVSQKRSEMFLQISVPIDHGSSGGPLINVYGEVIGITSGGHDNSHANLNYARDIRVIF